MIPKVQTTTAEPMEAQSDSIPSISPSVFDQEEEQEEYPYDDWLYAW